MRRVYLAGRARIKVLAAVGCCLHERFLLVTPGSSYDIYRTLTKKIEGTEERLISIVVLEGFFWPVHC